MMNNNRFDDKLWKALVSSERRENITASFLRKGVSEHTSLQLRPRVWRCLARRAFDRRAALHAKYYSHLIAHANTKCRAQIEKDVSRTSFYYAIDLVNKASPRLIPGLAEPVRNVLLAYAVHDYQTGYV